MVAEGMDYYETPLQTWMSHSLNLLHKAGCKPILLSEYQKTHEKSVQDLMERLDSINGEPWEMSQSDK